MKKKYRQGRISVSELVNDQNSLFNSELSTINTELMVIEILLDYFAIFPETQCAFNMI